MIVFGMDMLRQTRTAQSNGIAHGIGIADMQGIDDARTVLAQAISDRNEVLIRIYSETCLLLLEANRTQAARMMAMMNPGETE